MKIFLKGYYGYKNLGDELLLFGVLDYLSRYNPSSVVIQAGDEKWLDAWLERNRQLLPSYDIQCIPREKKTSYDHLVLGGGDLLSARFPRNGWNYLPLIFSSPYTILGGISTPTLDQKILYPFLLGNASSVVVREPWSYTLASTYSSRVVQHEDFAFHLLRKFPESGQGSHFLINVNRYIDHPAILQKVISTSRAYSQLLYVPFDRTHHDQDYFSVLKESLPTIECYDWTEYDVPKNLSFFAQSVGGIGARLHFLIIMKFYKKLFTPLVYQEKVQKFIDLDF